MKLHAVKLSLIVSKRGSGTAVSRSDDIKSFRYARNIVVMRHQNNAALFHSLKQRMILKMRRFSSIFAYGARLNSAAVDLSNILHTVAYAEHGNAERKHPIGTCSCALFICAVRSARKYNAAQRISENALLRCAQREKLAKNAAFSNSPSHKLIILTAKVKYNYSFGHSIPPLDCFF